MKFAWHGLLLLLLAFGCKSPKVFPVSERPVGIRAVLPKAWPEAHRAEDQAYLESLLRKALGNPPEPQKDGPQQGIRLVLASGNPDPRLDVVEFTFLMGVVGAIQGLPALPVGPPIGFGIGVLMGPFAYQAHEKRIRELGWAPWLFSGDLEWGPNPPPPAEVQAWYAEKSKITELKVMAWAMAAQDPDPDQQRRLSLEALARAAAAKLQQRPQPSASRPAKP